MCRLYSDLDHIAKCHALNMLENVLQCLAFHAYDPNISLSMFSNLDENFLIKHKTNEQKQPLNKSSPKVNRIAQFECYMPRLYTV